MSDKVMFGKKEAISILIIAMTTQLFLGFPRNMAIAGGTAGWILPIYACILSLILFFIISKLYSSFGGKDILDIAEFAGGNVSRILVGTVLITNYVFIVSIVLRTFAEDIKVISLTQSPISFVILFFIAGMIVAAYFGVEAIGRLSAIIVPMIAIGFIIVVIGTVEHFRTPNLLPILGTGPYDIFVKGISRVSIFSGLSLIFIISPFVGKYKSFKSIGFFSIIISGLFLTLGSVIYLLVVPYPVAVEYILPIYHLARYVDYGRFFQRIESVFVLLWSSSALLYLSFGMFFIVYVIKKTFKLNYYRPLILPVAIILFTLSLVPQSMIATIELEVKVFRPFAGIITFAMPLAVLIFANAVKRKKEGGIKREK